MMMDQNQISHLANQIRKLHCAGDYEDIQPLLKDLEHVTITVELLQQTGVAKVLYQVMKSCPMAAVKKTAKRLLSKWKRECAGAQPSTGNCCFRKGEAEDPAGGVEGNGACLRGDGCGSCDGSDCSVPQEVGESWQSVRRMTENDCGTVNESPEAQRCATKDRVPCLEDSAKAVSALDPGTKITAASSMEGTQTATSQIISQIAATHTPQDNNASPLRSKCVQLLLRALAPEEAEETELASDLRELAHDIEEHIFKLHGQNQLKYKSCIRSKVSNLKNPKSPHLRQGLLRRQLKPETFARMTTMEMASQELKELRAEYTESGIREHQRPLGVEGTPTKKIRCRRCNRFDCRVTQVSRGVLFLPGWVRSGNPNEDTVTFVTCSGCGEQWYHSSWVCL